MKYLSLLNNQVQSLMVVLLFVSTILFAISTLLELLSTRKIKFTWIVFCQTLNLVLCVVWAYVFFSHKTAPICEVMAYFSIIPLAAEIPLFFVQKQRKIAIDFPFFVMLLPFWKYASTTLSSAMIVLGVVYLFAKALSLFLCSISARKCLANYYSLKEALDGLDTALMLEDKFSVLYENTAMAMLLEKLNIGRSKTAPEIWQRLKSRSSTKPVDEQTLLVFLDDKVYSFSQFCQAEIQIYAFDITKEYSTTIQIERKQAELKINQGKILKMIENLDEIERQKEVLALKSKLHDIIGQRLYILHHILDMIDERNFDIDNVKTMLTSMLFEIDNGHSQESQNMCQSVISAFQMIGFDIVISGEMPQQNEQASALVKIIREAATNAIRHANATKLFVDILDDRIEICDNGKVASNQISENTGIKGIRQNAMALGKDLSISTIDGFKITLLPTKLH